MQGEDPETSQVESSALPPPNAAGTPLAAESAQESGHAGGLSAPLVRRRSEMDAAQVAVLQPQ
eukprot:3470782-Amphidinium_carterae.1